MTQAERPWRGVFSALCAVLVGIGLARFAYTPLLPALIEAGWFAPSQAAYLGAANLAGYLVGALLGQRLTASIPTAYLLRTMMLLAALSLLACAAPLSFSWFFVWRFASGLAGGVLMVVAAPSVLPFVPPARRGLAGGVIFTGVGLGIAASGVLLPPLLSHGLPTTWTTLGAAALILTAIAWPGWGTTAPGGSKDTAPAAAASGAHLRLPVKALYLAYGLSAFGLVPHMVFLVDFVARGLERGIATGAHYWVLFGLGALCGPVLAGTLADRFGVRTALRAAVLMQAVGAAWLAVSDDAIGLILSSLIAGAFAPGVSVLTLGRVNELLPSDASSRKAAWSLATVAFAVGQAAGAYGLSFLYDTGAGYPVLFGIGSAALMLSLAIDLIPSRALATSPTPS